MKETVKLPDAQDLGEAGLIELDSGHDWRRHVVEDEHYAGELAAMEKGQAASARIQALCGEVLILGSLAEAPSPACPRCARLAAPPAAAAASARADTERAQRPPGLLTRAARATRIHLPTQLSAGRHSAAVRG